MGRTSTELLEALSVEREREGSNRNLENTEREREESERNLENSK